MLHKTWHRALAVLVSVLLLSLGWWGISGLSMLVALVPLLIMSEGYSDSHRDWWRMCGWAALTFLLWNAATIWWVWIAAPIGPITAGIVGTFYNLCGFMMYHYASKRAHRALVPLVAHTFGIVSIVGVLLNPIVILCAYIIVTLAVVWTIMPIAPIAGVYGWVLSAIGLGLNFVVKGVAAWSWSAVELELPAWAVWVIYGVAVAITMVVGSIKPKKSVLLQL